MKKKKLLLIVAATLLFTMTITISFSAKGQTSNGDEEGCCFDFGDYCLLPVGALANHDEC